MKKAGNLMLGFLRLKGVATQGGAEDSRRREHRPADGSVAGLLAEFDAEVFAREG